MQTGGQGEAPGTDRQEAPPFFTESIHIQIRVQPEVKSNSQINVLLKSFSVIQSLPFLHFMDQIFDLHFDNRITKVMQSFLCKPTLLRSNFFCQADLEVIIQACIASQLDDSTSLYSGLNHKAIYRL